MTASYLEFHRTGKLRLIAERIFEMLGSCQLCPRRCKVNRLKDEKGFCRTGLKPKVCSFLPHHGEEPPISGERGSGTIFFSQCNMACVYCQNYEFSQLGAGREVEFEELADYMLQLEALGCHNINLVTPTHVLPQILKSLALAAERGLTLPIVYNTGGYELEEIIQLLDGIVDIYLPDMRYADARMAQLYSCAPDYPGYNRQALQQMHRQVGLSQINEAGIIERGVIIRHLVLPGNISGTESAMEFIAHNLSADTYISLMSQYFPCYKAEQYPQISRRITRKEYKQAQSAMRKYGLCNGWIQESGGLARFAGINIKPALRNNDAC